MFTNRRMLLVRSGSAANLRVEVEEGARCVRSCRKRGDRDGRTRAAQDTLPLASIQSDDVVPGEGLVLYAQSQEPNRAKGGGAARLDAFRCAATRVPQFTLLRGQRRCRSGCESGWRCQPCPLDWCTLAHAARVS